MRRSRYLDFWEGRYTLEGPYRRPSLLSRICRRLAWLFGEG